MEPLEKYEISSMFKDENKIQISADAFAVCEFLDLLIKEMRRKK